MAAWAPRSTTHHRAKAKRRRNQPRLRKVLRLSWQPMISINDPATQVARDKIPKNNLIAAIHQRGSTGPEASGGGENIWHHVRPSVEVLTWISPGCVWRFVQALSWDHKRLFEYFIGPRAGRVLKSNRGKHSADHEATQKVPQSHKFTRQQPLINNIAPRHDFHTIPNRCQIQIITWDIWSGETKRSRSSGRIFYFLAGDVCGRRNRFDPSAKANGVKPRLEK